MVRQRLPITVAATAALLATPAVASAQPAEVPSTAACEEVIVIGDSLAEAMAGDLTDSIEHYLDSEQITIDAAAGRSVTSAGAGTESGAAAAARLAQDAAAGTCWTIVLGTMDAAAADVGSAPGPAEAINIMLQSIGGSDPVFWVDPVTGAGAVEEFSDEKMVRFTETLQSAATADPNLAVLNWGTEVERGGFAYLSEDHIHYTPEGYTDMADYIGWAMNQVVYQ